MIENDESKFGEPTYSNQCLLCGDDFEEQVSTIPCKCGKVHQQCLKIQISKQCEFGHLKDTVEESASYFHQNLYLHECYECLQVTCFELRKVYKFNEGCLDELDEFNFLSKGFLVYSLWSMYLFLFNHILLSKFNSVLHNGIEIEGIVLRLVRVPLWYFLLGIPVMIAVLLFLILEKLVIVEIYIILSSFIKRDYDISNITIHQHEKPSKQKLK